MTDGGFCASLPLQFCEWLSSSVMCKGAGRIVDLLLEHVGQVQLCRKLTALLDSKEEWRPVSRKSRKAKAKTIDNFSSDAHFINT